MAARKKPDDTARTQAVDYIPHLVEIRSIAQGANAEYRTMTWREAVEVWELDHSVSDERGRAALFVHIGIATTDECKLLDGLED